MNRAAQIDLFEGSVRLHMDEAIELTVGSILAYAPGYEHWGIAYSGGKDSSALVTLVVHLIETGRIPAPKSLSVFCADTRMELVPLWFATQQMLAKLRERGVIVHVVRAALDESFFVYMLGRGVPPPNSRKLRWCTRLLKAKPMEQAIAFALEGIPGKMLMLTGVRKGESAIRDRRIDMSCSKDDGECGQGWFQSELPNAKGVTGRIATLAPLLHWRVCHIWDWNRFYAPSEEFGGWPTKIIAEAYGQEDEEKEIEAATRTGCVSCNLVEEDKALAAIVAISKWAYLAPLKELKALYDELRRPENRLRQRGDRRLKDGSLPSSPNRLGPLTMTAREMALARVVDIQRRCNEAAETAGMPRVDILNDEEIARIRELIAANTWPDAWDGTEPTGNIPIDTVYGDGWIQPLMV